MNEKQTKPICKLCVHFRDRARPECLSDAVNLKYPPYLVDGVTFKLCLEERSSLTGACGEAGKLFKSVKQSEIPVRLATSAEIRQR